MELTVRTKRKDTVSALGDELFKQLLSCFVVNRLLFVAVKRRDHRNNNALKC